MRRKVLDRIYMMILPGDRGIVYQVMANTPGMVWARVIDGTILGTGYTRESLYNAGYRVKRVEVSLPGRGL